MKKQILALIALCTAHLLTAQVVRDTATMSATYANNVWYSLENDDQGTSPFNNWDIALSTATSPTNALATAIHYNYKVCSVYEIPGSDPTDFANADTTGLYTWTPLQNSEDTWSKGAFNNTIDLGGYDYGWGSYNPVGHTLDANRIFVIKYKNGQYRKVKLNVAFITGVYTLVYDKLDNTAHVTKDIAVAPYTTKNFVYYNFLTETVVDREPASASWDLTFHQYLTVDYAYSPFGAVGGVFHNVGVQVAEVNTDSPESFNEYAGETFSDNISTIGHNWKAFSGSAYTISDSTVYFVKDVDGDVWKLIMTYFSGTSAGKFGFSKEKLGAAGIGESAVLFASLYPNPASYTATLAVTNAPNATIEIYNMLGALVHTQSVDATQLTAVNLPVSDFNNGLYQVVCRTAAAATTHQLSIQH